MHLEYWGLKQAPFGSKLSLNEFFESATHAEAVARLQYLVQQNRRLGVLIGANGTGKSLTLELLARRLRRFGGQVGKVNLLGLSSDEFLWKLAASFGCYVREDANTITAWRHIQDRFATFRYQQSPTVLLLDDADEAETDVLTTVNRLAQMEQHPQSRLSIVLTCNKTGIQLLGTRLLEMSELPIELEPFSSAETADYINVNLARVGRLEATFTDEALFSIHELTGGIPRAINQLTEICLLGGAGEGVKQINGELVRAVRESFYSDVGAIAT